ncbi:MAG: 3-methyl-2-oxobutanoate dehydrogenase subunit VorB [Clostridia bacterium]|nr:3-methyl-2-oxobutanoate dehydrogenase subunit VorB [Clostridia bacterium]
MSEKKLMKGNEAVAEGAIRGGCRYFFGYPITPQNEIPEYMSWRMREIGGDFVQAESEVAAINMVYGAAGAGARAMTSSSSPGVSLKQEGISYLAMAELPCVIVNMTRSGPGLGGIQPSQGDYFQTVKGGGHGDYRLLTYAPSTVQEAVDLLYDAFDKSEEYGVPVFILGDGILGQIMEPVSFKPMKEMPDPETKKFATTGHHHGKDRRIVNSLYIEPEICEPRNLELQAKYKLLQEKETMCEEYLCDDAEIIITAFGSVGRIARTAIDDLRAQGVKVGMVRPITVFPFPTEVFKKYADKASVKAFLDVELNAGQMIEDVKLSVNGKKPVEFLGKLGGYVVSPEEICEKVMEVLK